MTLWHDRRHASRGGAGPPRCGRVRPVHPRPGLRPLAERRPLLVRGLYAGPGPGAVHHRATPSRSPRGLEALAAADTVVVPGYAPHVRPADDGVRRPAGRGRTRRPDDVGLHRRLRPGRRGAARRPARDHALGATPATGGALSRRSTVDPDVLYVDEGRSSPAPASRPASTSASISCATTTAWRPRPGSPGGWWWRRTAPAGRRSSSSGRCRRPGTAWPHLRLDAGPTVASPLTVEDWPGTRVGAAHLRPPLPGRDRHDATALAGGPAPVRGPPAARDAPTSRSTRSPSAAGSARVPTCGSTCHGGWATRRPPTGVPSRASPPDRSSLAGGWPSAARVLHGSAAARD